MKKIFSFLFFPATILLLALTTLTNNFINPANKWYINLPLVLIMLCFLAYGMYCFLKETEIVKNQNSIVVFSVPILFVALVYFCKDIPVCYQLIDNKVFVSNCFLTLGAIFAFTAFSLRIKRVLGDISVYYKFVGIVACALSSFGAIYNCFQDTITMG